MTSGAAERVQEEKVCPWSVLKKDQGSTNKHPRSRTQAPGHQIRHPIQEPGPKPEPEARILTPEPGPRSRIQLPNQSQEPSSGVQINIKMGLPGSIPNKQSTTRNYIRIKTHTTGTEPRTGEGSGTRTQAPQLYQKRPACLRHGGGYIYIYIYVYIYIYIYIML